MKQNLEVQPISLKRILENLDKIPANGKFDGDEIKKLSPQEKKQLMQLISNFNEYGKVLRCEVAIMETAKNLDKISQMAEAYALTESGDFFQAEVIKRDFKNLKGVNKDFKKLAQECYGKQLQLNALFENAGTVLQRYYEIKTLDEMSIPPSSTNTDLPMSNTDDYHLNLSTNKPNM